MDILLHGVVGAALCSRTGLPGGRRGPVDAAGRRRLVDWTLPAALAFGLLPDLLSFGIHFSANLIAGNGMDWHRIPPYIFMLYNLTHSLAGMAAGYALLAWWRPALRLPALAWPVHVLVDAPTHGTGRFMTPIFWPFSENGVSGWNWWEHPGIFAAGWLVAAGLWLAVVVLRLSWRKP